jgi:starvation-inducible DNA-binding protein
MERIRQMGSISSGVLDGMRRVPDRDTGAYIEWSAVLAELSEDYRMLSARLKNVLKVCEWHRDIETASWVEIWIDKTQSRTLSLDDAC